MYHLQSSLNTMFVSYFFSRIKPQFYEKQYHVETRSILFGNSTHAYACLLFRIVLCLPWCLFLNNLEFSFRTYGWSSDISHIKYFYLTPRALVAYIHLYARMYASRQACLFTISGNQGCLTWMFLLKFNHLNTYTPFLSQFEYQLRGHATLFI